MTPEIRQAEANLLRARQRFATAKAMEREGLLRRLPTEPLEVLGPASWDVKIARDRVSALRYRYWVDRRWVLRRAGFSAEEVTEMLTTEMRSQMKKGG